MGRINWAKEFEEFCEKNNIVRVTSPAFHLATNGAAEKKCKNDKKMQ